MSMRPIVQPYHADPHHPDYDPQAQAEKKQAWWRGSEDDEAVLQGDDVEYADESYFPSGLGRSCLTDEQWAGVAYFLAAGVSVMEVARHFGVSRTTIWRGLQRSAGLRHRIRAERNMRRRESDGRFVALRNAVVDGLQQAILDRNIRVLLWAADRLDLGGSVLPREDDDPMRRSARARARRTPRAVRSVADAALDRMAASPPVPAADGTPPMAVPDPVSALSDALSPPLPAAPAPALAPLAPPEVDPPVIVTPSDALDLHRELAGDRPIIVPEWQTWGPHVSVTARIDAMDREAAEEDEDEEDEEEDDEAEGQGEIPAAAPVPMPRMASHPPATPPADPLPVPAGCPAPATPAASAPPDRATDGPSVPDASAPRVISLRPRRAWPALRRLSVTCSRLLPIADDVDGLVLDQLCELSRFTTMPRPFCDTAQPLDPYRPLRGYRWR